MVKRFHGSRRFIFTSFWSATHVLLSFGFFYEKQAIRRNRLRCFHVWFVSDRWQWVAPRFGRVCTGSLLVIYIDIDSVCNSATARRICSTSSNHLWSYFYGLCRMLPLENGNIIYYNRRVLLSPYNKRLKVGLYFRRRQGSFTPFHTPLKKGFAAYLFILFTASARINACEKA